MKLEKFNLEKAIHGAKVVTRDGREVKELTKFEGLTIYSLVGVLDNQLQKWTTQGIFNADIPIECGVDLFLAVEPQRIWVNVYYDNYGKIYAQFFRDAQDALHRGESKGSNHIKTIEITDEL